VTDFDQGSVVDVLTFRPPRDPQVQRLAVSEDPRLLEDDPERVLVIVFNYGPNTIEVDDGGEPITVEKYGHALFGIGDRGAIHARIVS
jgi:hypothetical protein